MRILVCQLNPVIGDILGNSKKIIASIERGKIEGVDLVVFPEMVLTGYPPQDLLLREEFLEAVQRAAIDIASHANAITVVFGLPRKSGLINGKPLYNSLAICQEGKVLTYYDKQLLPDYDVFHERRYFEPGCHSTIVKVKGKDVAFLICEDIWVEKEISQEASYLKDPINDLVEERIDLLVVPTASPFFIGKGKLREELLKLAAKRLKAPAILCNQVGANDQLIFDGNSLSVDKEGNLIDAFDAFQEEERVVFEGISNKKRDSEECFHALVLGVRDYCHKLGFQKVLIGLSGGIDSSLVLAIGVEALGAENVIGVLMPSRYTSNESQEDALALAKNFKVKTYELPIESMHMSFLKVLEEPFNGALVDVTEENIQSRIRGTLIMALSNKWNALVLNTGNKSELATGYCTLYGDMCGALSVIGDLTKGQVYNLSSYVNRKSELIPKRIFEKEPTAELKPGQKDSDSLPPYALLDKVVVGYLEEGMSPEKIAKSYGFELSIVKKLIQMIHRNEYKRHQAPPILKVSKKTFSKGRHYPIVEKWI